MGKELISHHLVTCSGRTNCATTALTALVPKPLEDLTVKSLYDNTRSLNEIIDMASLEFHQLGIKTYPICMANDNTPSKFFVGVAHQLKHGPRLENSLVD